MPHFKKAGFTPKIVSKETYQTALRRRSIYLRL